MQWKSHCLWQWFLVGSGKEDGQIEIPLNVLNFVFFLFSISKVQMSQVLEEVGNQKQRAEMVRGVLFFFLFIIIIFLMLHIAVMYAKFSAFEMWIGSKYLDLDSKWTLKKFVLLLAVLALLVPSCTWNKHWMRSADLPPFFWQFFFGYCLRSEGSISFYTELTPFFGDLWFSLKCAKDEQMRCNNYTD